MTPAQGSSAPEPNASTFKKLRDKALECVVVGVVGAIIGPAVLSAVSKNTSQPWQVIWFVLPFIGLCYVAWKFEGKRFKLVRSPMLITLCYVLVFLLLAGSRFLDLWEPVPVGYEEVAPHSFVPFSHAVDWRYAIAREKTGDHNFIIVTMKQAQTRAEGRYDIGRFIKFAVNSGAKGIAFDFYFKQNSQTQIDEKMCAEIKEAESKGRPIFVGYGFHLTHNEIIRESITANLAPCLPDSSQGHLLGSSDWDGTIRQVPLHFKNDPSLEALSLKVAKALDHDNKLNLPEDGLLRFIKPAKDFDEISYDDLIAKAEERERLKDKFVLVGERDESDTFNTAYSRKPGVVIHSYAIHSLRNNHFVRRAPWWAAYLMILLFCYLILIQFALNARGYYIALVAFLATVIVFAASAAAMYFWLVWVDIIYPIVAIWLLVVALGGLRRIRSRRSTGPVPEQTNGPAVVTNP
jgi:hypothetical protein